MDSHVSIVRLGDQLMPGRVASRARPGTVIWITGLSGAGKSTVARGLESCLARAGLPVVLLDGDVIRTLLDERGHGRSDRLSLALTYAALCREIALRGAHVVCATISMFHAVHDWNRANQPRYLEVYLKVPMAELRRRDPKGLYARADAGEISDMVGVHIPAEEPRDPHLLIQHGPDCTAEMAINRICAALSFGMPQ